MARETNAELAGRLASEAAAIMHCRRVLLTASVALANTSTVAAVRRALAELDGVRPVVSDVLVVLDELRREDGGDP